MLVEARRYRLAALAFCRNSGSVGQLARATISSRANVQKFLDGRFGFVTAGRASQIERLLSERERAWVQEAPRFNVSVGHVPTELLAPVITESFAKYGRTATATMVGTVERQLYAMTQERTGVSFRLADLIVTKLAGPGWWLETAERRRWYFNSSAVFGKTPPAYVQAKSARRRELIAA